MELNERMGRLEMKQSEHDKDIRELQRKASQLHADLNELKNIMNSIKYWLYGIGTFFVVNEAGMTVAIKKYLGIG